MIRCEVCGAPDPGPKCRYCRTDRCVGRGQEYDTTNDFGASVLFGRPGGILTIDEDITDEQAVALRRRFMAHDARPAGIVMS